MIKSQTWKLGRIDLVRIKSSRYEFRKLECFCFESFEEILWQVIDVKLIGGNLLKDLKILFAGRSEKNVLIVDNDQEGIV